MSAKGKIKTKARKSSKARPKTNAKSKGVLQLATEDRKHRAVTAKQALKKTVRQQGVAAKKAAKLPTLRRPIFGRLYAVGAGVLLLATTAYWAFQSALIQLGNADQLVNVYLFDNMKTFRGAVFPDQHSFLFKWPLFWLVHMTGSSGAAFVVWTVITALIAVIGLAYILYRVERRPLVYGTLWLAMASVLLLIPAQPYPGGILPVNMAMLTTRNLEYLVYIAGLVLVVRSRSIKEKSFLLAVVMLAALIASDKLFLSLSLGGALLLWVVSALLREVAWIRTSLRWLLAGIIGGVVAFCTILLINTFGLTNILGDTAVSPYALIGSGHEALLGGVYAILAILTNFGANPIYDGRLLWHIPSQIRESLIGPQGIAFIVNALLLCGGMYAVTSILRTHLLSRAGLHTRKQVVSPPVRVFVAVALCTSSLVAVAEFMFSKHYYPVDARYLAILFFAIFVSGAVYAANRHFKPELIVVTGGVILLSIAVGMGVATRNYTADQVAMTDWSARNRQVADALERHKVDTLLADYWRAFPIRESSRGKLQVTPLAGCTQARTILGSSAWQPDLGKHSFAYLLQLDPSLAGTPSCTEAQVEAQYGPPTETALLRGTLSHPRELLLFYDQGAYHSQRTAPVVSASVTPIKLWNLPSTICPKVSTMDIVAHQDDDLLFMNPDTFHAIQDGDCVRTIYVTAGDAGRSRAYWLSRQQGVEAAYATMLGLPDEWVHRLVEVTPNHFVTVANPRGHSRVSLIFMNLPDGNMHGEGFLGGRSPSLARLEAGRQATIKTVDEQSNYSLDQLQSALTVLMQAYKPEVVRTQSSVPSEVFPDHSDHRATGRIAARAYQQYIQNTPAISSASITYYMGYPIHALPPNLSYEDVQTKQAAFFAYGQFDPSVCDSVELCAENPTYWAYLGRQYTNDH